MSILYALAEFITTPLLRWFLLFFGLIFTVIQYLNSPQRFSYEIAEFGISYKWYLYLLCMLNLFTSSLTTIGQWATIPFTDILPDYWYIYLFILFFAIITQITISSPQILDDGSFNPPPIYIYPQKYRVIMAYISVLIDTLLMVQLYIYNGIADPSKKTLLSYYILERFGGWIDGNKLDFLFEWSGMFDVFIKIYILLLQKNFVACEYGLPSSWNA